MDWMPAAGIQPAAKRMLAFEVLRSAIRTAACYSKLEKTQCTLLLLVAMRHLRIKRNCKQENISTYLSAFLSKHQ
jgi:hypothetical protein